MSEISATRQGAARAFARFVATSTGRGIFSANGYESGTPVLPANEHDTIVSVMARVRQTDGDAVVVAVHFPERAAGAPDHHEFEFLQLMTCEPKDGALSTGGASTIGMLADHIKNSGHGMTVAISHKVTAGAFDLVGAR